MSNSHSQAGSSEKPLLAQSGISEGLDLPKHLISTAANLKPRGWNAKMRMKIAFLRNDQED